MNPSRIEQAIKDIIDFVDECKPAKLQPNKVMVDRDEFYELLDALESCAPEEISRYQKVINNQEAILADARKQANEIIMNAQNQTAQLLDQNDLVQAAYARAEEINRQVEEEAQARIDQANYECEQIQKSAMLYTHDLLSNAEQIIKVTLGEVSSKTTMLESALKSNLDIIKSNKAELVPGGAGEGAAAPANEVTETPESETEEAE